MQPTPRHLWAVGLACAVGCGAVRAPDSVDADAPGGAGAPDGDPVTRYDVGYINEITLTPSISALFSFALVVNQGTRALDARSVEILAVKTDNPGIDWTFMLESAATQAIPPSTAAGALSNAAASRLVQSGLVTESVADPFLNFAMAFRNPPPAGLTLNAQATIRIDGKEATLPFLFHVIASGDATFDSARRVHSQP